MSGNDPGNQGRSDEDAEDVRLMQLVGRGDTVAFEELVERHQALVAGTVARMLGSRAAGLYSSLEKRAPIRPPRQIHDMVVENYA